jgi:hypothetical protein
MANTLSNESFRGLGRRISCDTQDSYQLPAGRGGGPMMREQSRMRGMLPYLQAFEISH